MRSPCRQWHWKPGTLRACRISHRARDSRGSLRPLGSTGSYTRISKKLAVLARGRGRECQIGVGSARWLIGKGARRIRRCAADRRPLADPSGVRGSLGSRAVSSGGHLRTHASGISAGQDRHDRSDLWNGAVKQSTGAAVPSSPWKSCSALVRLPRRQGVGRHAAGCGDCNCPQQGRARSPAGRAPARRGRT